MDTCMCMAESLQYSPETHNVVNWQYPNTKKKKKCWKSTAELPWWTSGQDFVLPLQGNRFAPWLGSQDPACMPCGGADKWMNGTQLSEEVRLARDAAELLNTHGLELLLLLEPLLVKIYLVACPQLLAEFLWPLHLLLCFLALGKKGTDYTLPSPS